MIISRSFANSHHGAKQLEENAGEGHVGVRITASVLVDRSMEAEKEPAAAMSSSQSLQVQHLRLTMLQQARSGVVSMLDEREKEPVLADAGACLERMKEGQCDVHGEVILSERASDVQPAHVAAALALICGYYSKQNGTPNPSAAAEAFGQPTSRPAKVTEWVEKLRRLEAVLDREFEVPLHKRHREDDGILSRETEEVALLNTIAGKDSSGVPSLRLLALRSLDAQRLQGSEAFVAYWHNRFAAVSLLARERAARTTSASASSHHRMEWFFGMLGHMHGQHASFCGQYGLIADEMRVLTNCGADGGYCQRLLEQAQRDSSLQRLGLVSGSSARAWRDETPMADRAISFESTLIEVSTHRWRTYVSWNAYFPLVGPVSWEKSLPGEWPGVRARLALDVDTISMSM